MNIVDIGQLDTVTPLHGAIRVSVRRSEVHGAVVTIYGKSESGQSVGYSSITGPVARVLAAMLNAGADIAATMAAEPPPKESG
jgi:hypothetical protein